MLVKMFTDGACRFNPGPGGYAAILQYTDSSGQLHEKEITDGMNQTTNNQMELMAVITGFENLKSPCDVEVYSDSKYVVDAFTQGWIDKWILTNFRKGKSNEVKNIDLWLKLIELTKPHNIKWFWVKGHNGHPENERCDKLATTTAYKFF